MEQSSDLAVRREVCYVEVCCVVFVRLVCQSTRNQHRPGDERLVYHPKYPTLHGLLLQCGIPHMEPSMGYSECPHGAHAGTSIQTHTCEEVLVRALRVHCEPLPSRRDAPDVTVAFTLAPKFAAYLRCARQVHGVCVVFHLIAACNLRSLRQS